ncbi:probable BOI-related E3 ubiquitin-protein ligase 3 [Macadamia integrifolia]|uniref:probable BOI-related E3 ubiquitin-protein ligase 3 n=1 Tax=Macadamia integrifolia TaxID=60698 RepID=UPI001C52EF5C|nr:probable BOI-related E3 ubiquitin-protein ligase 3 [Macadamia integrifolia]
MAVEARYLNLFPSQLLGNREMMNMIGNNNNIYNTQMGLGAIPFSTATTTAETLLPFYNSVMADPVTATTTTLKADSGLTYNNIPVSISRKLSRDSSMVALPCSPKDNNNNNRSSCSSVAPLSFLGEDITFQIQQQQLEIDRFVAQHTEKVRIEIAERRKRHSRRLMAVLEERITKRLKAKEEEIEKIGKLNWVLEERVKSLCVENQIWRDLAQTNEATANALRSHLEQVLAQAKDECHRGAPEDEAVAAGAVVADDAASCCGSSDYGADEEEVGSQRTLVEAARDGGRSRNNGGGMSGNRWCRNCGKEESCVLLLPCRHLCLCTVCGSTLHTCPICKSNKNASVHVNMSSS